MSNVTIPYRFVVKRDTAANFTSANTLLLEGEWALELDTGKMKMGDGSTAWNSLPYKTLDIATPSFIYTTDTGSTADSDPGSGLLKWNNATQSSATKLYIDDATADTGTDLSNLFAELASSSTNGILHMVDQDGAFKVYKWTGIADGTGYFKFTVSHMVSSGGNFADNIRVRVLFLPMPAGGGGGSSNWTLVQKSADQSRSSTTTFADDSELVTATLGVGIHIVRGSVYGTYGAGNLKYQGAFSGTATVVSRRANYNVNSASTTGITSLSTNAMPSGAGFTATYPAMNFEVVLNVTVAGVFSFQWAQNSSNAANTTIYAGSYLEYR